VSRGRKTHRGKFTPKNPHKYAGDPTKIVYRSGWEKCAFIWADTNSNVLEWSSEEVVVPYKHHLDDKTHRYFVDLYINHRIIGKRLVEIKPYKETIPPTGKYYKSKQKLKEAIDLYGINKAKWKAANTFAAKRGMEFKVWDEHKLRKYHIMS
jgi:hypothetical protein